MIGQNVGKYRIIDKIGEGGMGTVYKAEDTTLDRLVALKTLSHHLADDEEARERFLREAKAASSLNHPNIATVYELLEEDGQQFIVMEYVDGKTIRDMAESGRVSVRKALDITLQAAEALQAAHNRGILHRDIKSANIMVTMEGRAKVMDFGLAHLGRGSELTRTGTTMGTLAYASPEQLTGADIDRRSEIYSLGVVLYELLTGRRPFEQRSEGEMVFAIINNEPAPVDEVREDVPEEVAAIIRRALDKKPDLRYQNDGELIRDLKAEQKLLETSTVALSPASTAGRGLRALFRPVPLMVAGAVVVLAVVGSLLMMRPTGAAEPVRLAVLPFMATGAGGADWQASSVADEIRSMLVGLDGIAVLSRSGAVGFEEGDKTAQQLGRELQADYVLTGSVHWGEEQGEARPFRMNIELARVPDDALVWSKNFQEDFSQIFTIQREVVGEVASGLGLSGGNAGELSRTTAPTTNTAAYDYYLRGVAALARGRNEATTDEAMEMFSEATALDPDFALAYAGLSRVYSDRYWFFYDRSVEAVERSRRNAARALDLDPRLPEAHIAMGWYHYHGHLDYESALAEFRLVEKSRPNDTELLEGIGSVLRRQGRTGEALEYFERAADVARDDPIMLLNLTETYGLIHRYREASATLERSLELAPDSGEARLLKIRHILAIQGDVQAAKSILADPSSVPLPEDASFTDYAHLLTIYYDRDWPGLLSFLDASGMEIFEDQYIYLPSDLLRAMALEEVGEMARSRALFRSVADRLEEETLSYPDDARRFAALGTALAGLGEYDRAIREAEHAAEVLPVSKEAWRGLYPLEVLAAVMGTAGQTERAVRILEWLITNPGELTTHLLELDVKWDPLRDDPGFQRLLKTYRPPVKVKPVVTPDWTGPYPG